MRNLVFLFKKKYKKEIRKNSYTLDQTDMNY